MRELGVSSASLSNILSGKNGAGARTAMRLAQLLGRPYETFMSPEQPPLAGDPRAAGFRRFVEFVEDELPELLEQLSRFRAERFDGASHPAAREQATMTRIDWEARWRSDFRLWRKDQRRS